MPRPAPRGPGHPRIQPVRSPAAGARHGPRHAWTPLGSRAVRIRDRAGTPRSPVATTRGAPRRPRDPAGSGPRDAAASPSSSPGARCERCPETSVHDGLNSDTPRTRQSPTVHDRGSSAVPPALCQPARGMAVRMTPAHWVREALLPPDPGEQDHPVSPGGRRAVGGDQGRRTRGSRHGTRRALGPGNRARSSTRAIGRFTAAPISGDRGSPPVASTPPQMTGGDAQWPRDGEGAGEGDPDLGQTAGA